MKFVFWGTRELGAKVLERLLSNGYSPSLVITGPDKLAGRKQESMASPVKKVAQAHNLPLAQPAKPAELLSRPELQEAELFVLAAYGSILPKELVELPRKGILNVHPSLLPLYRGPAPERGALLNGDEKTGVTVMLMDEAIDHGPILAQEEFAIPKDIRHEELHQKLGEIGGDLLVKILPLWLGGEITPKEQNHDKATFTKKVSREDGRIDWNKEAMYIERQVRAFYPWPGTFATCEIDGKQKTMKILQASVLSQAKPLGKPGQVFPPPLPGIAVQTSKDALFVEELQMEGGKPMSSKEFLLGHKNILRTIFY